MTEREATDRFLTNYAQAWKNEPDVDPPRYWQEEAVAYFKQQKATTTNVDIGEGDLHVQSTDTSERIYIFTNRGTAEVEREDLPELIRVLQGLVAGPTAGGALNAPQVASAPPGQNELAARSLAPNIAGVKSQYDKNIESMERALGIRHR